MKIDRSDILDQALGILDDYGLADLTMRRLADALGVKPGAIYWHYENKQTLLAAVSDAILEGVGEPSSGDWRSDLRVWAGSLRAHLLEHRDAADVVSSTRAAGLGHLDPASTPAAILVTAGWGEERAGRASRALVHLVLGHVVEEQSRLQLIELGVLPAPAVALDDEGFREGVDMLLDGMKDHLAVAN